MLDTELSLKMQYRCPYTAKSPRTNILALPSWKLCHWNEMVRGYHTNCRPSMESEPHTYTRVSPPSLPCIIEMRRCIGYASLYNSLEYSEHHNFVVCCCTPIAKDGSTQPSTSKSCPTFTFFVTSTDKNDCSVGISHFHGLSHTSYTAGCNCTSASVRRTWAARLPTSLQRHVHREREKRDSAQGRVEWELPRIGRSE